LLAKKVEHLTEPQTGYSGRCSTSCCFLAIWRSKIKGQGHRMTKWKQCIVCDKSRTCWGSYLTLTLT